MTAPSRLARLLALVPWLAANDGIALPAAAQHFGVSVEQLEQDLWLLIVCGLPGYGPADLVDIQFWDDGRIHVLDAQTLHRPLRLTADEATSLLLGLRVLQQVPGSVPTEALDRAAAKLEGAIEARSDASVVVAPVESTVARALDAALTDGSALAITYAAATRDEVSERIVQPLRMVSVDGVSSLVAYCSLAEGIRTFRVDRIVSAVASPRIAVPEREVEADRTPSLVTLELGSQARWIVDAHEAIVINAPDEGPLRVQMNVHDLHWLGRLVLAAGPDARVVDPPEAVEAVRDAALRALNAYAGRY
jgi:proteasome accessory factor C